MAFLNKAGLERLWTHILLKLNRKVDKVDGKSLSTNDFTTEEKEKLANLEEYIENATNSITPEQIGAVSSVNGKTGEVILNANDIGAVSMPPIASIGQILKVKTIDNNGKPTEWETLDPWVISSTTEGSTKQFKLTIDDEGVLTATEIV